MKKLIMIAAAVAVLALGTVALGGAVTSAQEGDGPIGTFIGKVAEKLGITQDELTTAIKEARIEMIDEAVAEGRLTEEQAQELKDRIEEGDLPLLGRFGEGRYQPRPDACQRGAHLIQEATAEVLDIPVGQIVQEMKQGSSLAEIAEANGMGVEEFTQALLDQVQSQLDELVADGKLTQEQAERIYDRIESNIDRIVNATPRPHGPCAPHRGPGGPGGPDAVPFEDEALPQELSEVEA